MAEPALFAVHAGDGTVLLERTPDDAVCWRHWGARVEAEAVLPLASTRTRTTFSPDEDVPLALMPAAGLGWFGEPGVSVRRSQQALVLRLACASIACEDQKLAVALRDDASGVAIELAIEPIGNCVRFTASLENIGDTPLSVDRLASAVLPLSPHCRHLISFTGRHNGELVEHRETMPAQQWVRQTRQGMTGHGGPPGVFVLGEAADWHAGEVWALQLAWSGNHALRVEPDGEGGWTLTAWVSLEPGEIVLAPGERFAAPAALACFSAAGRNGAVQAFHEAVRAGIRWPGGKRRPRPVHFNTWESVYFAHDEGRMIQLAEAAAQLGVERFVVDDGWFAGRDSDHAGLGDWVPDPLRYPRGLLPLARQVNALGMEFGLWVEPEMVNPDSDLYRAHPDWVLGAAATAPLPTARHQLVLDMARADVRDHLFAAIAGLLDALPIAYLKWDHNRALAPAARADGVGGSYEQVRGTWDLWDRVRAAFPHVEIEACAAGGGRIDAGFAGRAHRFWTSDNIDALSRVEIQRGFLQFMPPELMGAHVGASPAHATGRPQSLDFSAMVALPGHFGVERNPAELPDAERQRLGEWIEIYKSLRERFHAGRCWLGQTAGGIVWQAHGEDGAFLVLAARKHVSTRAREAPLRLPMLRPDGAVRIRYLAGAGVPPSVEQALKAEERWVSAQWLANHGLALPNLRPASAVLLSMKKV